MRYTIDKIKEQINEQVSAVANLEEFKNGVIIRVYDKDKIKYPYSFLEIVTNEDLSIRVQRNFTDFIKDEEKLIKSLVEEKINRQIKFIQYLAERNEIEAYISETIKKGLAKRFDGLTEAEINADEYSLEIPFANDEMILCHCYNNEIEIISEDVELCDELVVFCENCIIEQTEAALFKAYSEENKTNGTWFGSKRSKKMYHQYD